MSFSQLPTVKKYTIFGAASKIFGPSYFVTALSMYLTGLSESGVGWPLHPKILSDQLTFFKPGDGLCIITCPPVSKVVIEGMADNYNLPYPPDFQTFLRPCLSTLFKDREVKENKRH